MDDWARPPAAASALVGIGSPPDDRSITFIILVIAIFFLASSGASAAYLTASEIFPMETRALAIAFFYAIGTAAGGIAGPLLFDQLINTDERSLVAIAFVIGSVVMAVGGLAEVFFGVKAEGAQLEDIAKPLTVSDAEQTEDQDDESPSGDQDDRSSAEQDASGEQRRGEKEQREAAARTRERVQRHAAYESAGMRRYRSGPGRISGSPGITVSTPLPPQVFDHEIDAVVQALEEHGVTGGEDLARMVDAGHWGPGLFQKVLRKAIAEGLIERALRNSFRLATQDAPA